MEKQVPSIVPKMLASQGPRQAESVPVVWKANEAQGLVRGTRGARWRVRSWDIRPTPYIKVDHAKSVSPLSLCLHMYACSKRANAKRDPRTVLRRHAAERIMRPPARAVQPG